MAAQKLPAFSGVVWAVAFNREGPRLNGRRGPRSARKRLSGIDSLGSHAGMVTSEVAAQERDDLLNVVGNEEVVAGVYVQVE
jgi:hypothetical protein